MIGLLVGGLMSTILLNYWPSVLRLSLAWGFLALLAWWMGAI